MTKALWPKIRQRTYRWQDKSGAVHKGAHFQINCQLLNGTRYQKSFKERKEAESDAARLRDERDVDLKNRTVSLNHLSDSERIDVLQAREKLEGKATLLQCALFYLDHNILPTGPVLTVNAAIERYTVQSKEDGLRPRSLGDLKVRLQKFAGIYSGCQNSEVSSQNKNHAWRSGPRSVFVFLLNSDYCLLNTWVVTFAETFGEKAVTSISRPDADRWLRGLKRNNGNAYRIQFDRVRRKAGYKKDFSDYPKNAGRHTYATMALQKYQSANKAALMLGHTTTGLLFDHYKSLATPKEAVQYWSIKPSQQGNIISFAATA